MKSLIVTLISLLTCSLAFGSHWGTLSINEITVKTKGVSVNANTDVKKGKLQSLKIDFGETKIEIPATEFTGLEDIDLHSLRLVTLFGQGNAESAASPKSTLMVTIDFGKIRSHFDFNRDKIITVRSRVRFVFDGSKYTRRQTCIPKENLENEWSLYEKDPGQVEVSNGTSEKAKCPYPGAIFR